MKTLLFTGGTGDLGNGVVPRLARDYQCVLLLHGSAARDRVPSDANVVAVESASELGKHAPLFGVVSLAGAFAAGAGADTLSGMLDANLFSFVRAFDAVAPHLEDGGRVIAISSAASLGQPSGLAAYNASKAALNAYIQTLAKDLAPRSITANALLPTTLDTPQNRAGTDASKLVPLDRIAEWIALLLSDRGTGVTGQLIQLGL